MHTFATVATTRERTLHGQLGLIAFTALVVDEVIAIGIFLTPAGMARSLSGALCYGARRLAPTLRTVVIGLHRTLDEREPEERLRLKQLKFSHLFTGPSLEL